jgi:Spy/CpxP family protein refolding chaperone
MVVLPSQENSMKTALIASALALISLSVAAAERPSGLTQPQMEGLLAGRGMGLSMPAEMNGKPGPLHVLEHADALGLTEAQRRIAAELVAAMKAEAIPLGQEMVARESRLDSIFAADGAGAENLVAEIATLQGRLRWVHLRAHLAMTTAMTPEQVAHYRHLRP